MRALIGGGEYFATHFFDFNGEDFWNAAIQGAVILVVNVYLHALALNHALISPIPDIDINKVCFPLHQVTYNHRVTFQKTTTKDDMSCKCYWVYFQQP